MASLKEIKTRIASVESTRKVTAARQMISSAYLHRAQAQLSDIRTWKKELDGMAARFFEPGPAMSGVDTGSLTGKRALVIFSANTGMCGSFHARMIKEVNQLLTSPAGQSYICYPVGSKIREILAKEGFPMDHYGLGDLDYLSVRFDHEATRQVVRRFMDLCGQGRVEGVDLLYYHYQTVSRQEIRLYRWLPYPFVTREDDDADNDLIEPNRAGFTGTLINLCLHAGFYQALVSNQASEQACRMIAMQLATENADELQEELKLTFNKLRQQSITAEMQDLFN